MPDTVRLALMLMLLAADSANVLTLHDTASLTLILPTPAAVLPWLDKNVTLLLAKAAERVVPEMSLAVPKIFPAPILKSAGSISQVPLLPLVARVVTLTVSAILTCAAEFSINPPSPPLGAEASSVPPTLIVPICMSPINIIWPFSPEAKVRASITPVLLITLTANLPAALAVRYTRPPSALIAPPFSIKVSIAPCVVCSLTGPPRSRVTWLPAPSSTLPALAARLPVLVILAAISAIVPPLVAVMLPWLMMALLEVPSNL